MVTVRATRLRVAATILVLALALPLAIASTAALATTRAIAFAIARAFAARLLLIVIRSLRTVAFRTRRTQFVHGQFTVAVFIELLQGFGRLVDFVGRDDPIAVRVECGNDRRWRPAFAIALLSVLRTALALLVILLIASGRLGESNAGGKGEREEEVFVPGHITDETPPFAAAVPRNC